MLVLTIFVLALAVNFDCSSLSDGPYADPSQSCSTIFFQCSNGQATEATCPPIEDGVDSYFDDASKKCDAFDNVFACTGRYKAKTTTRAPNQEGPIRKKFSINVHQKSTRYGQRPKVTYDLQITKCFIWLFGL